MRLRSWHSSTQVLQSGSVPARPSLPGGGDELLERGLGVRDDPEVGREDATDLGGLDVDVNETLSPAVGVEPAGVPVGPAVADSQHEVRGEHGGVAVPVGGLQTGHACGQAVIVGDGAPAHQRRDHGHVEDLGQLDEQLRGVGVDDAAAGDDERPLGGHHHVERLVRLTTGRHRLVHGQRLIGLGVEIDLGQLDVDGQIDEDGTRPTGSHQVKRLGERARNLPRFEDGHRHLRHRRGDRADIDGLEVLLVESGHGCLAGDRQDRNGIR